MRLSWVLSLFVLAVAFAWPIAHYRAEYAHHKRYRTVTPGVLYRSGQLTADGFYDVIRKYGIRTVVNCQNEFPDPDLAHSFWDRTTMPESQLCRDLGVRYVHLEPDLLPERCDPAARPVVIDRFFSLIDDPSLHPILLHCKAGLHRTGVLVAAYRQEYDGWGPAAALDELKANGFGDKAATAANDYVRQYILNFQPRPGGSRAAALGNLRRPHDPN